MSSTSLPSCDNNSRINACHENESLPPRPLSSRSQRARESERKMADGKEREAEKRKLGLNDGVASGPQKKAREEVTGATDEEVDEFFAILRRIHVAVNYFKQRNGEGEGRKVLKETATALELESCTNIENNGVEDELRRVDGRQQNSALDLNAEPVADP